MQTHNQRKVAVTGIGMVTPLGNNAQQTWQALLGRQSGIADIHTFDASHFPTHVAAQVKQFDAQQLLKSDKSLKHAVSFVKFGLVAAEQALEDAGIHPTQTTGERWGLVAGSGMMTADYEYWERFHQHYCTGNEIRQTQLGQMNREFFRLSDFAKTTANSGLGLIAARHQIRGLTTSVHTACASGGQALGVALQALRRGEIDYALAGGFDSMINPFGLASFCLLGALSSTNDASASRPFDYTRDGFILGEGAAFLVLEDWQRAVARGARIYAELAGEGNSLSAYRITDSPPDGDGPIQAIKTALMDAGESADQVNYINAHGTSTKMNDLSETNAIKAVFGERAYQIPTSSTKSLTGHLIAAAGALEGAIMALAIHHQHIPMTANLTTPDPECDLDYVVGGPREWPVKVAISNSFGFGGTNSCVVMRAGESS
ncbi:MAG: beta-ketoacyl-ACP synthase II [Legionellales bacterium]|nr:beta-ketoacyl-ACP synthase II [Legionellales bacterium]